MWSNKNSLSVKQAHTKKGEGGGGDKTRNNNNLKQMVHLAAIYIPLQTI